MNEMNNPANKCLKKPEKGETRRGIPVSGRKRKILKITVFALLAVFLLVNLLAVIHAYRFTHFVGADIERTKNPDSLSSIEKLGLLVTGIRNPKPSSSKRPGRKFKPLTLTTRGKKSLSCWLLPVEVSRGTVVLFHGFGTEKSSVLAEAYAFNRLGYHALLVDFLGHGESEGRTTTIGYDEALDVVAVYDYLKIISNGEPIIFYGFSMGAVAVLRAVGVFRLRPRHVIVEAPFGSMLATVRNRFRMVGVPEVVGPELLVFWGSVLNGFWGFTHNVVTYARRVDVPVLVLYGDRDPKVTGQEVEGIYKQLRGDKQLEIFKGVGHESSYGRNPGKWTKVVKAFLSKNLGRVY
ncbi:MAG: alpha/beta hydrolase [bacterium]|nr:alpha/beta hydrolase [bacterium]